MNRLRSSVTKRCSVHSGDGSPSAANLVMFEAEADWERNPIYYPFSWDSCHHLFHSKRRNQSAAEIPPILRAVINGVAARGLVDSGASTNFIAEQFIIDHGLPLSEQQVFRVALADGHEAPGEHLLLCPKRTAVFVFAWITEV